VQVAEQRGERECAKPGDAVLQQAATIEAVGAVV
jgi:hypothetical protein